MSACLQNCRAVIDMLMKSAVWSHLIKWPLTNVSIIYWNYLLCIMFIQEKKWNIFLPYAYCAINIFYSGGAAVVIETVMINILTSNVITIIVTSRGSNQKILAPEHCPCKSMKCYMFFVDKRTFKDVYI